VEARPLEAVSRKTYEDLDGARQKVREGLALKSRIESLETRRASLQRFRATKAPRDQIKIGVGHVVGHEFAQEVQAILTEWQFPGPPIVAFDDQTHDILVDGKERLAQLGESHGHFRHRQVAVGQRVGERTHDARPHGARKIVQTEVIVGAGNLMKKTLGIAHTKIVRAERADADDAQILVVQHDRVCRTPLVSGKQARGDEIDVGLERRLEAVFPALQPSQDRNVPGHERMRPGPVRVGELTQIDELRSLRFADDELGAAFDGPILIGIPVGQDVARVVFPLDDFEQFVGDHALLIG